MGCRAADIGLHDHSSAKRVHRAPSLLSLVGLFSLRQFPVHWERNENKHAISKAYRMGSILWLAGFELDHRPNPAWLCLLRHPPPRLGHAIQLCTQQPKRSPLMPGASSELQLLTPAKR